MRSRFCSLTYKKLNHIQGGA
ncbi:MAG: bacteriocin [Parcubacteria group bacterium]|uniref:Bacteriocin n=1 Tax=Candidatus Sungiibacteriota bacterium TaxID=2750080 RepID=A0A9D6HR14_9BACT|nr:bacteriocin [Candidatus Sungbacteria bacterium]MBI4119045.1 bacteriocin [Parcubacteria group bacterium]